MDKQLQLRKKLDTWAVIVSIVIMAVVVGLRFIKIDLESILPFDIHVLPAFHAVLNSLAAVSLIAALYFIKQKDIIKHQKAIFAAMIFSALFLVSYVIYHAGTEPTRYGGEGIARTIYFVLLISHVVLAALTFPFILFTFIRGYTMQVESHRKMAKWIFPLWLYVAVTGPICYLMLMPYYS